MPSPLGLARFGLKPDSKCASSLVTVVSVSYDTLGRGLAFALAIFSILPNLPLSKRLPSSALNTPAEKPGLVGLVGLHHTYCREV